MKFESKVVLISGGTRGIGKATALMFAEQGAQLALIYKSDKESAEQTLREIETSFPESKSHRVYACDISDHLAIKETVDAAINDFGKIDILVNNAAYHTQHPIDKVDYEDWHHQWQNILNVNLIGTADLSFCVAQNMMAAQFGKIIFVSSRGAFRGEPDMPAYGASKAGVNALAQSLAQKLAPYNVHIGVVAPGFVETDLTKSKLEGEQGKAIKAQSPMNRVADPKEIAHAILFFADEKSVWSTGAILDLNGASYLRT